MTSQTYYQPKYIVVALYPNSPFELQQPITLSELKLLYHNEDFKFSDYPAIFQPIPWYEDDININKVQYFRHISTNQVFKGLFYEQNLLEAPNGNTNSNIGSWYVTKYNSKYTQTGPNNTYQCVKLSDFEPITEDIAKQIQSL